MLILNVISIVVGIIVGIGTIISWFNPRIPFLSKRVKVLVLSKNLDEETFKFFKFKKSFLTIMRKISIPDIGQESPQIIIADYKLLTLAENSNNIDTIINQTASIIIYSEETIPSAHMDIIKQRNNSSSRAFVDVANSKTRMLMSLKQMIEIEIMRGKHD